MLPASPAIAGARREPDPLHLLLTGIGRHTCFLGLSCPQLFRALPALLQYNRRTLHHVERAPIEFCGVSMSRTRCGADKPHACRWNTMRRAATLCMPVMGVARADGLYGHVLCQCDVYATRDAPEAAGTQRRATQSAKSDLFFVSCPTYGCNKPRACGRNR